jgi:hypothetical protein
VCVSEAFGWQSIDHTKEGILVKEKSKEGMMWFWALVFVGVAVIVVGFQFALFLGAPWGDFTLWGKFPGKMPASIIS